MNFLKRFINDFGSFLEKLDHYRDRVLFDFIKRYWPRQLTPNHLTFTRIGIGLSLFVILFYYKNESTAVVIPLFVIGILTDLFDGSVARALKRETNVGALLDPVADRILIIPIAFYSLFSSHRWLLLVLILFEVSNGILSLYAQGKNFFAGPNIFSKVKMVFQSIVFLAILVFWPKSPHIVFMYLLWISVAFMVVSMYVKILDIRKFIYGTKNKY